MKWSIDIKAESGKKRNQTPTDKKSTKHLILIAIILGLLLVYIANGGDTDIIKALLGV